MQFKVIKLKNFRNIESSTFTFTNGLNVLLGENGTGKSSILMGLGTLFNTNQIPLKELVKTGTKTAEVSIWFDSYVSTREFGKSSKWEVATVEGEVLAEGTNAVQEFMQQQLNMTPAAAFSNIMSAAQFDLQTMFKATPATQRSLFNEILQVLDFESAYIKMKDTMRIIKDDQSFMRARLEKAIENGKEWENLQYKLKTNTKRLGEVKSNIEQNQVHEIEAIQEYDKLLTSYYKAMSEYTRQHAAWKKQKSKLETTIKEIANFEANMSAYKAKLKKYEKQQTAFNAWQIETAKIEAKNKIHADHGRFIIEYGYCPVCKQNVKDVENVKPSPLPPKPEVNPDLNTTSIIHTANAAIANKTTIEYQLVELIEPTKPTRPPEPPNNIDETKARLETLNSLREEEASILNDITRLESVLEHLENQESEKTVQINLDKLNLVEEKANEVRNVFKQLGPTVTQEVCNYIADIATGIIQPVLDASVTWKEYKLNLKFGKQIRGFNSLSGGQQVIVALAMRLAMADYFGYNTLILDEPTLALDEKARNQLVQTLNSNSLSQIIVATHDPIFDGDTVIHLKG